MSGILNTFTQLDGPVKGNEVNPGSLLKLIRLQSSLRPQSLWPDRVSAVGAMFNLFCHVSPWRQAREIAIGDEKERQILQCRTLSIPAPTGSEVSNPCCDVLRNLSE